MSEYTPTTLQVEVAFLVAAGHSTHAGSRKEAFDRWLAAHDAEVRKSGYDEAMKEAAQCGPQGVLAEEPESPQIVDARDPECVKAWPACETFGYDPRCCRFPKSCSAGVVRMVPVKQEGESPSGLLAAGLPHTGGDADPEQEDARQPKREPEPAHERDIHPPRDDEHEQEQGAKEQVPVELHTDDSTPDQRNTGMKQEG